MAIGTRSIIVLIQNALGPSAVVECSDTGRESGKVGFGGSPSNLDHVPSSGLDEVGQGKAGSPSEQRPRRGVVTIGCPESSQALRDGNEQRLDPRSGSQWHCLAVTRADATPRPGTLPSHAPGHQFWCDARLVD